MAGTEGIGARATCIRGILFSEPPTCTHQAVLSKVELACGLNLRQRCLNMADAGWFQRNSAASRINSGPRKRCGWLAAPKGRLKSDQLDRRWRWLLHGRLDEHRPRATRPVCQREDRAPHSNPGVIDLRSLDRDRDYFAFGLRANRPRSRANTNRATPV